MKQHRERGLMLVKGDRTIEEWSVEQVFTGERLYSYLQIEVAEAIDLAVSQVMELRQLSVPEIAGIVAHGLMETAMRQIMAAKMPCTREEFEAAARVVYDSCHAIETGKDARRQ